MRCNGPGCFFGVLHNQPGFHGAMSSMDIPETRFRIPYVIHGDSDHLSRPFRKVNIDRCYLAGGFKYFLFSSLFGEGSNFD